MALAIETRGLVKSFAGHLSIGKIRALQGIDLAVPTGVIYGFLGPNGAGKTTTLKILTGLLRPDAGTAQLLGAPVGDRAARGRLGFLPESPYFYDYLTGAELVRFFGQLHGLSAEVLDERTPRLLKLVGLHGKENLPLRKYSKGMLQRAGIAQALVNDPDLVILDEPMSGLDPIGRREVRDLILSLKAEGKTVFFSSHILADAESICDEVAILVKGKVAQQGNLETLLGKEVCFWDVTLAGWGEEGLPHASATLVARHGDRVLLRIETEGDLQELLDNARGRGGRIESVSPHKVSLEELFLSQIPGGTP